MNDKINIICDDYLKVMNSLKQDIIFFDPPWGGWNYKKNVIMNLKLSDRTIDNIISELISKKVASLICVKVPFNYDFKKLFSLINKTDVYTFYKENNKVSFYMVTIFLN